jgi:hypothetical protein
MIINMNQKIKEYIYSSFDKFINEYGFYLENESKGEGDYWIKYASEKFVVLLEHYRRDFTVIVSKSGNPDSDKEIALANLLDFCGVSYQDFEYFLGAINTESELLEYYKKELDCILKPLYENIPLLEDFFTANDYEEKLSQLSDFMRKKYPNLYKHS